MAAPRSKGADVRAQAPPLELRSVRDAGGAEMSASAAIASKGTFFPSGRYEKPNSDRESAPGAGRREDLTIRGRFLRLFLVL